jgi:cephalosporin hydroxylase
MTFPERSARRDAIYKPTCVVTPPVAVTLDEMREKIMKTREEHGETLQKYHEVWYNNNHTWSYTHFLGIGLMKNPNDLWAYQSLISDFRPRTIIETGTYQGASALWFAFVMQMLGIDGQVRTIEFEDHHVCSHPAIEFIHGSSVDHEVVEYALRDIEYPLLISLDSDHSEKHVREELELYAPAMQVGDWIIVEDTNISWNSAHSDGGDRCARGGVEDYMRAHPNEFTQDVIYERWLLSMNPGGWIQRIAGGKNA